MVVVAGSDGGKNSDLCLVVNIGGVDTAKGGIEDGEVLKASGCILLNSDEQRAGSHEIDGLQSWPT